MHIYKNSLILRICMNDDLFPHPSAFTDYKTSFLKKSEAAEITLKLLDKKGIINPDKIIEALGEQIKRPKMPDWITKWIEAENNRPWPPDKE